MLGRPVRPGVQVSRRRPGPPLGGLRVCRGPGQGGQDRPGEAPGSQAASPGRPSPLRDGSWEPALSPPPPRRPHLSQACPSPRAPPRSPRGSAGEGAPRRPAEPPRSPSPSLGPSCPAPAPKLPGAQVRRQVMDRFRKPRGGVGEGARGLVPLLQEEGQSFPTVGRGRAAGQRAAPRALGAVTPGTG